MKIGSEIVNQFLQTYQRIQLERKKPDDLIQEFHQILNSQSFKSILKTVAVRPLIERLMIILYPKPELRKQIYQIVESPTPASIIQLESLCFSFMPEKDAALSDMVIELGNVLSSVGFFRDVLNLFPNFKSVLYSSTLRIHAPKYLKSLVEKAIIIPRPQYRIPSDLLNPEQQQNLVTILDKLKAERRAILGKMKKSGDSHLQEELSAELERLKAEFKNLVDKMTISPDQKISSEQKREIILKQKDETEALNATFRSQISFIQGCIQRLRKLEIADTGEIIRQHEEAVQEEKADLSARTRAILTDFSTVKRTNANLDPELEAFLDKYAT